MDILGLWQSWIWLAGLALGLSIVLAALVYMLSELLQNDKMKGWAKMEFTEVVYSAIILSLAIAGLPLIDSVIQGSLGVSNTGGTVSGLGGCSGSTTAAWISTTEYRHVVGTQQYECLDICGEDIARDVRSVYHGVESCHMRLGIWYLRELFDESKTFAFDTYLSYIWTSMVAEFTINIEFIFEQAGFFTFTPWKGFFTMGNKVKEMVFDWTIKLMMLIKFQEVMLRFIATALFPALFVSGAMLRAFVFTRRLGGLLLAMGIALYFIYPSFYAFGALVMLDIKHDPNVIHMWMTNESNPGNGHPTLSPRDFPDPPISNMMYARGTIPMPGGGSTGYNMSEVRDRLRYYEGLDSDTYFRYMEAGHDSSEGMLPLTDPSGNMVDFSSTQYEHATERQQDEALANARQEADTWFGSVSRQSKLDKFIDFAWGPNGPLETLSRLTFWATFFSLFSIIGTIAAIRSLSMTFGGDIEIAGLTRLI